jgi:hypothetical protein
MIPPYRIPESCGEHSSQTIKVRKGPWLHLFILALCLIPASGKNAVAVPVSNPPVLISETTSTRAIAIESITFTPEPFALTSSYGGLGQRTRIMIFAMNLSLQPGEDSSVTTADAEDAAHQHHVLVVEAIRPVPAYELLSAVVLKLSDDLGDVGDVLVSVSYRGVVSNRVRIAIGHRGGGPADDPGAAPTPALPYRIGGQLTSNGQPLSGRSLNLTGPQSQTAVTDTGGFYVFNVAQVGQYTITPTVNPYYTFIPQTFTNVNQNHVVNFTGTLLYYTVSGRIQIGPNPAEIFAVPITGSQTTTVTTDGNGRYSIGLPAGGNYVIAPVLAYHTFAPVTSIVSDLTSDQINRDFIATRQTFTIGGKLKDQEGHGLPGLTVNLGGADDRSTVTDGSGDYRFQNLFAGYNYTVTPPSTAAYTFASYNVNDLRSDQTLDIVGLRRLALTGRVLDQNGNGLIGITMTLAGTETATTKTAADGSYSLVATATGNYSVTPSIPQDFYMYAPVNRQFNNLALPEVTNFTATFAPLPDPSYVLEFDGQPKTVDYGNFWNEGVNLGHFFWEFWAMPGDNAGATYLLSDGYGGAHALLFGVGSFNSSESDRYELLGNIFDGVRFDNYFGSDVGPAAGEWGHFAVGWDGQNIVTYFNGVPVGKTPFAGPRRTPGPGGGGGRLLIGGSDHSNFDGRIAQVRGYEDANPREALPGGVEASFAPETVFRPDGNLLSYYFRSGGTAVADLSHGYNGVSHAGWARGTTAGVIFDCGGCPPPQFVVDPSAPNFATNTAPSPVSVPSPPAPPVAALVFDSFSRPNSTYVFAGHGGLGTTEGGSAGIKT